MKDVLPNQRVQHSGRGTGTVQYGLRNGRYRVRFDDGTEALVHQNDLKPLQPGPRTGQAH